MEIGEVLLVMESVPMIVKVRRDFPIVVELGSDRKQIDFDCRSVG